MNSCKLSQSRIDSVIETLHAANRISDGDAEKANSQLPVKILHNPPPIHHPYIISPPSPKKILQS